jgi:hypothetical protein
MTKKGLIKKIVGVGAGIGLSLMPIISNAQIQKAVNTSTFRGEASNISNAQDYSNIQKGVNAATLKDSTKTHFIYEFKFNEDLKRAIKNSQKPHLYTTGVKNSYIKFNRDSSAFELYYPKTSLDESGKGKTIGLTIRDGSKVGPCDNTGLGSRYSPLPSLFWTPTKAYLIEESSKNVPEEPLKEKPSKEPCETIINSITNNYYYGDTTRNKSDTIPKKLEKSGLEFRTLIEGSKRVNPINSPFWGATINPQMGKNWIWAGPYLTFGFGSQKDSISTPVYKKILLSQAAQLFTETEGTRRESSKLYYPTGFGGTLSLNTKDNKVRFDLSYGLVNEINSTSGVSESGFDRKLQGDNVIEEKPYNVQLEEGKKCSKWIPIQRIGMAFQPSNKVPIYLEAEAEHIGDMKRMNCKKGNVNFNVKLGGNIGWGKR